MLYSIPSHQSSRVERHINKALFFHRSIVSNHGFALNFEAFLFFFPFFLFFFFPFFSFFFFFFWVQSKSWNTQDTPLWDNKSCHVHACRHLSLQSSPGCWHLSSTASQHCSWHQHAVSSCSARSSLGPAENTPDLLWAVPHPFPLQSLPLQHWALLLFIREVICFCLRWFWMASMKKKQKEREHLHMYDLLGY